MASSPINSAGESDWLLTRSAAAGRRDGGIQSRGQGTHDYRQCRIVYDKVSPQWRTSSAVAYRSFVVTTHTGNNRGGGGRSRDRAAMNVYYKKRWVAHLLSRLLLIRKNRRKKRKRTVQHSTRGQKVIKIHVSLSSQRKDVNRVVCLVVTENTGYERRGEGRTRTRDVEALG